MYPTFPCIWLTSILPRFLAVWTAAICRRTINPVVQPKLVWAIWPSDREYRVRLAHRPGWKGSVQVKTFTNYEGSKNTSSKVICFLAKHWRKTKHPTAGECRQTQNDQELHGRRVRTTVHTKEDTCREVKTTGVSRTPLYKVPTDLQWLRTMCIHGI